MRPIIDIRDLSYRYDDGTPALSGVSFQLFEGETVALFGPNGSGKTTFVMQLVGLLHGEGQIKICGLSPAKQNLPVIRRKVGIVFQNSDDQLFMPTVLEDIEFGPLSLGLSGTEAREVALKALDAVQLREASAKAPYHLSAGEKRRVALAGVLAMSPEILVLDEPTTFLDPPSQRELVRLLRNLPQAKILVTHDTTFASALATRAVFFEKGAITAEGPTSMVIERKNWAL